jgi:hypothetical protein
MDRQTLNAGVVTRRVKAHLRQAALPECRVRTRYTRLAQPIGGRWFAWQACVLDLDADSAEAAETLLDNLKGLLRVERVRDSLWVTVEDQ